MNQANGSDPIHVFFTCNNAYVQHMCVVIASVLKNSTSRYSFHVIHRDITTESIKQVESMRSANDFFIEFIRVDEKTGADFKITIAQITIEGFYRIGIPWIRPELDRAIYLDCDLVVRSDLAELWNIELKNQFVASVASCINNDSTERRKMFPDGFYFNSGVMLLNLKEIRSKFQFDDFVHIEKSGTFAITVQDQDILNVAFRGGIQRLPQRWNVTNGIISDLIKSDMQLEEIASLINNAAIRHYTGQLKPWVVPVGVFAQYRAFEYFDYLRITPFDFRTKEILKGHNKIKDFIRFWRKHPLFFLKKKTLRRMKLHRITAR